MRWISVKDELPKDNIRVLVFDETFKKIIIASYSQELKDKDNFGWHDDCECCGHMVEVNFWLPLPLPPSESQCKSKCLRCKN